MILSNRACTKFAYDWAITLLQRGLGEDWNRGQYQAELARNENSPFVTTQAGRSLKSILDANPSFERSQRALHSVIQRMLETFISKRDELASSKPELVA
jgi:hypothetical protein